MSGFQVICLNIHQGIQQDYNSRSSLAVPPEYHLNDYCRLAEIQVESHHLLHVHH